eukprot:TRINITY_DN465_c1_g1_i4.p1 TRINITY_DN465_c1_g1~~TRINITY_DN465_c1_g1_i4.p1  ORF type:complete len:699 (+),score=216.56 TRINITY_DN465_c1_g1_i4:294-2099(+)
MPANIEFEATFDTEKVIVSKNELTVQGGKFMADIALDKIFTSTTSISQMKHIDIIGILRFSILNVQSVISNGLGKMMIPPISNLNVDLLTDGNGLDVTFTHFLTSSVSGVNYKVKVDYNGTSNTEQCSSPTGCPLAALYADCDGLETFYGDVTVHVYIEYNSGQKSTVTETIIKHVPAFSPSISLTQTSDNKLSISGTSQWDTSELLSDDLSLKIEFYDCGESESETCVSKKEFTEVATSASDFVIDGQELKWTFENTLLESLMQTLTKLKMEVYLKNTVASESLSVKTHDFFKVSPVLDVQSMTSSAQDGITITGTHYWFNTAFVDSHSNSPIINVKLSTQSEANVLEKQYTVVDLGQNDDSEMTINIPLSDLPSDLKDDVTIQVIPQVSNPNSNYSYKSLNDESVRVRVCEMPLAYPTGLELVQSSSTAPSLDSEILLGCESGYQPTLDSIYGRMCVIDGHDWVWSGLVPSCVSQKNSCDDITLNNNLKMIANSHKLGNDNKWNDGTKLVFGCEDEYRLVGSSALGCSDGLWSGRVPVCMEASKTNNDKQCKPGTEVSSDGSHCTACRNGYYSTNGICYRCPLNWKSTDISGSVSCMRL